MKHMSLTEAAIVVIHFVTTLDSRIFQISVIFVDVISIKYNGVGSKESVNGSHRL